jgi:predicted TIM-barrel fold metal-dependent hydrolase
MADDPRGGTGILYFDSLVHVTSDGKWFETAHDASVERLLRNLEEAAPARACVVGIAGFNMADDFVMSVCRKHSELLVPVAGVEPGAFASSREARAHLTGLSKAGFRAVKVHPAFSGIDLSDARVHALMDAAAETGMPVFLCTYLRSSRYRPSAPPLDLVHDLVRRHPETWMLLLHGGTTEVLAFSDLVRGADRLLLDLSFTLLRYRNSSLDPDLRYVLETLDRKCTVGSDFPEYRPSDARSRVLELMEGLPPHKIRNVLHDNLAVFLGARPPGGPSPILGAAA